MNFQSLKFSIFLLLLFTAIGCTKEGDIIDNPGMDDPGMDDPGMDAPDLRQLIDESGDFPELSRSRDTTVLDVVTEIQNDVEWECTTEQLSIEDATGGESGFSTYSPNSEVIYPGNMLQGNSLSLGTPEIVAVDRAGGNLSININDGNGNAVEYVESITVGNVSQGINNIINGSSGVVPSNFNVNISSIQSREEFAFAMGLDLSTTFTDVSAKLKYESQSAKNKFLVNLNQSYYTISYDIPTSLDKLFAPTVTTDDLSKYVGPGNPPTYISSVTYGRVYYMLIESNSSKQEMEASINASFNGALVSGDVEVDVEYMSALDELTINVFAYGGDSEATLLTTGNSDLSELTQLLSAASNIESGLPLSYVVRSVYDNQIVATSLATTYDIKNCVPIGANGAPPYTEHWTGNVVSRMGPIGAAYCTNGTEFILINQAGDEYLRSNTGVLEGPFQTKDMADGNFPFSGVGAACNVNGSFQNFETVITCDLSGTEICYMLAGNWGGVEPISEFGGSANPFALEGVGALAFHDLFGSGFDGSSRIFFNKGGTKYSLYNSQTNSFSTVYDLYEWGQPDGQVTERISGVGAAIGFDLGSENFKILFDKSGTQYVIYGNISGDGNRTIGPFSL